MRSRGFPVVPVEYCLLPMNSLGATGTRYTITSASVGAIPDSPGVRYTARSSGWHR